jgi:hypothetical protein
LSIGDASAVIGARGAAADDQMLQVRKRLGDRESALVWAAILRKQDMRERVRRPGLGAEGGLGCRQALLVMGDELSRALRRLSDGLAVTGQSDAANERFRPRERSEVVAERVGPRLRIEPHGGRDRGEQVVSGDHRLASEQADVPVGMSWKLPHAPPCDLVALIEQM